MSASLLQKSLRLIEEKKDFKKKSLRKKTSQQHKWKSIIDNINNSKDKNTEENILTSLKKLEKLDKTVSVVSLNIADKIFSRKFQDSNNSADSNKEDKTVFSEKDFEEFEKEYFIS